VSGILEYLSNTPEFVIAPLICLALVVILSISKNVNRYAEQTKLPFTNPVTKPQNIFWVRPKAKKRKDRKKMYKNKKRFRFPSFQELAGYLRQMFGWLGFSVSEFFRSRFPVLSGVNKQHKVSVFGSILVCILALVLSFYGSQSQDLGVLRVTSVTTQSIAGLDGTVANLIRYFFILLSLGAIVVSTVYLMSKNWKIYADFAVLVILVALAAIKHICSRVGCCFGVPWPWGVEAVDVKLEGETLFPVQEFEFYTYAACCLIVVLFMLFSKLYRPGRAVALSAALYAVSRGVYESFRYHDEDYRAGESHKFFGLYMNQIFAIILVVLSVAWWLLLPQITKLREKIVETIAKRITARAA
jgi:hypothetical protein